MAIVTVKTRSVQVFLNADQRSRSHSRLYSAMGRARPRYNEKARSSSRKATQKPHPRARNGGIAATAFEAKDSTQTSSHKSVEM
jgi:hypothetical protein